MALKNRTCSNSCAFYDPITNECGIYSNVDLNSARTPYLCPDFIDSTHLDGDEVESNHYIIPSPSIYQGKKGAVQNSSYPMKPDIKSRRPDAIWYVSPGQVFGCWIINKYKKRLYLASCRPTHSKKNHKIYPSPYPLHNHNSSLPLASKMCWYIDTDGWGQYTLLVDDYSHPIEPVVSSF